MRQKRSGLGPLFHDERVTRVTFTSKSIDLKALLPLFEFCEWLVRAARVGLGRTALSGRWA
jgi:hypothetical protein